MAVCAAAAVLAGASPLPPPRTPLGFEAPAAQKQFVVKAKPGGQADDAAWRCDYYRDWMLKSVSFGGIDDGWTAVVPVAGVTTLPDCSPAEIAGQRVLLKGMSPAGLIGNFVVAGAADGLSRGAHFTVVRVPDGRVLYADQWYQGERHRPQVNIANGVLDLRYFRVVVGPCSIIAGRDACWKRFAEAAKFPRELAERPAPVATCQAGLTSPDGYRGPDAAGSPSVLAYDATVRIDLDGKVEVLSRGPFACWASE